MLEAIVAALVLLAPAMGRGSDTSFAYHGLLLDEKGHVLDAQHRSHSVVFRIYGQASGGEPLWTCTRRVFLDAKGQFSVELAGNAVSGESLSEMFAANASKTLYVGLTVDGDAGEIAPRQKLLSVPKAVCAANCIAAKNGFLVGDTCKASSATVKNNLSAGSLVVTNALTCGALSAGSMMTVTNGNLAVQEDSGVIEGAGTIPIGGIVFWNGSVTSIPNGWALCDGNTVNGRKTPNLKSRFVVGAGGSGTGAYKVGATGGEASHKLSVNELPSHTHSYQFKGADVNGDFKPNNFFYTLKEGLYDFNNSPKTNATGGGQPHENRPPYYALCYIMRVK